MKIVSVCEQYLPNVKILTHYKEGGQALNCSCCDKDLSPKHDGKAILQHITRISDKEYVLCTACIKVIRWVDKVGKEKAASDGNR